MQLDKNYKVLTSNSKALKKNGKILEVRKKRVWGVCAF